MESVFTQIPYDKLKQEVMQRTSQKMWYLIVGYFYENFMGFMATHGSKSHEFVYGKTRLRIFITAYPKGIFDVEFRLDK